MSQTQALATTPSNVTSLDRAHAGPMGEWRAMREQASALVQSGFLPKAVNTPEKAIAIMQTGKELGIGPMQALRCIHILDGKPVMAAELIAGLVLGRIPNATLRVSKTTNEECVVLAARPGQEATGFRWTMQDAQRAGLGGKDNWRKYPRAMLRNRALAEAARGIFPDATMGLYDPDELGAVTNERGEIAEQQRRPHGVSETIMTEGDREPSPANGSDEHLSFRVLKQQLDELEKGITYATTYDEVLSLRETLGSKGKFTPLTKAMQEAGPERRLLAPAEYNELNKTWSRCDRQLAKLEAKVKKPDAADSFTDPPDEEPPSPEDDGRP